MPRKSNKDASSKSITIRIPLSSPIFTYLKTKLEDESCESSTWAGVVQRELTLSRLSNTEIRRLNGIISATKATGSAMARNLEAETAAAEKLRSDILYLKEKYESQTESMESAYRNYCAAEQELTADRDNWRHVARALAQTLKAPSDKD